MSSTVKPVYKGHSQKGRKLVFKTDYRFMEVKSIAECSNGNIMQYFRPSLSYHLSLRSLFCLFLSGRFTQVLLYFNNNCIRGVTWSDKTFMLSALFCLQDIPVKKLYINSAYGLLSGQLQNKSRWLILRHHSRQ